MRSRTRLSIFFAVGAVALALVLPTPGSGPASAATGPATATLPGCTATIVHDSCAVTALTDDSVTMTFTATPAYTYCNIGTPDPCIYQFFAQFDLSTVGAGGGGVSGSCPGANQNKSWTTASDYIGLFNASALSCSITWTWNAATTYPLNASIQMTELDGSAITDTPMEDHGFGVTLPPPGPRPRSP